MAKSKSSTPSSPREGYFFYRKQVWKTTWKFRLLLILIFLAGVVLPYRFWARQIGHSLVCTEQVDKSDAVLLENFDVNFHVFERAAKLQKAGVAPRVLVQSLETVNPAGVKESSRRVTRLVAQNAKLENYDLIPIREIEPISQNAARQVREFLKRENVKSVVVVTPGFRSRRSEMVYGEELGKHGIRVGCSPVFENVNPDSWTSTWHGMQQVVEQFMKLQYYRFYVLR